MKKLVGFEIEQMTKRTTPLFIAAKHNQKKMVEYLMDHCKNERTSDMNGVSPLFIAVKEGNIEIVKMLLDKDSVDERDNEDRNVFHYAFLSRKPEEVTKILKDSIKASNETSSDFVQAVQDLLTAKDLNEDTPFHILAEQKFTSQDFEKILKHLNEKHDKNAVDVLECLNEKNSLKETPLHKAANQTNSSFVQAVLELGGGNSEKMEQLLLEKDDDSNTPLHLASRCKRIDIPPLLDFVKKKTKEPVRYLTKENIKGWTPFSGAVAIGSMDVVKEMLEGLTLDEKRQMVNQADFNNTSPLHVAAKYGHVDVFNLLLENGANITREGPEKCTALDVAIERDQRGIIQSIIQGSSWEKAFQVPSTSRKDELDTPLRKLIRKFPDLAEEFLDQCCTVVANKGENENEGDSIKMDYSFIEDSHSYRVARGKEKQETQFIRKEKSEQNEKQPKDKTKDGLGSKNERKFKDYEVNINNHPLMIMAKERRVDLLQHPLCLAITLKKWTLYGRSFYFFNLCFYVIFLLALNLFILSSDSPLDWPEKFNCSGKVEESANDNKEAGTDRNRLAYLNCTAVTDSSMNLQCTGGFFAESPNNEEESQKKFNENADTEEEEGRRTNRLAHLNKYFRIILLLLNVARLVFFFATQEFKPIWNQLRAFQWARPSNLPTVFLFDSLVYCLALFVACYHLVWEEGSCLQWQICAVTITLAWINLLLHMRLLYGIGQPTCYFSKIFHLIFT